MTASLHYAVFGGVLGSSFEFPELRAASPPATWRLHEVEAPTTDLGELLGTHPINAQCTARLHRTAEGLALTFDDTGRFDIPATGDTIRWHRGQSAELPAMRTDVLGRCLALAMHQRGMLTLHASGVVFPGGAIALVAPSGTGKSSLAFALLAAGGRLLSDDTLPLEIGEAVLARPGVQSIRLREDSAAVVAGAARFTPEVWGKREYRELPDAMRAPAPAPLAAIYVLAPAPADAAQAATAEPLNGVLASLSLLGQHKLGALLGGSEAPVTLARTTTLTRLVPVNVLRLARELARLPEAAATIAGWHGG